MYIYIYTHIMQNRFTCVYECNALYVYRCNVVLDPEAETRSFRIGRRCNVYVYIYIYIHTYNAKPVYMFV